MASLDTLPPDQRAVLELVLRRGRSYDEIAEVLSIDRAGVRQRALAALDALGPQTRVAPERRALVTDYLLGALPEAVAEDVRGHLTQSASERAWARAVSSELQGLSDHPLPEVPEDAATRVRPGAAEPAAAAGPAAASQVRSDPAEPAAVAAVPVPGDGDPGPLARARPTSRRGGALLLAAISAAIVAVVLLLVLPGGAHKRVASRPNHTASAAGTTGATGSTDAKIVAQINLRPPSGAKTPAGIAEVLRVQGKTGIVLAAQGLPANSKHPPNFYAVWLSNTPSDSQLLGFVAAVGSSGQLRTAGGLPSTASRYQRLLLTLETSPKPKAPGRIILEGQVSRI